MKTTFLTQLSVIVLALLTSAYPVSAMYSVGPLTQEQAEKSGITVKSRTNGNVGIKVWLEIEKDGFFGDFAWIELRMKDEEGLHLLSTRLQPHPVVHGQSEDIVTVSFSVDSAQLKNCSFWLCKGGSLRGGEILTIKVSDFLNLPREPSL